MRRARRCMVLELVGLVVFLQLGSIGGQSRRGDPHGHARSRVKASVKPVWTAWSVANGVIVRSRGVNAGRCFWSSLSSAEPDVGVLSDGHRSNRLTGQSALSGTSRGWRYHSEVEFGWYTFRDFEISRG